MNTGKKSSYWVAVAILLPFLAVVALMVSAGSGQVVPPPTDAKLHQVSASPLMLQDSYLQQRLAYGRVEATSQANAGFELAGYIEQMFVDEGQQVSKGQMIASLDTKRLDASMQEANAALERAKADARLAELSEKRIVELVRKKLESPQRLDEARERTVAAKALVAEVSAKRDSLTVELNKSVLRAPFDAEVISRPVDPGTVVAAGQPVFMLRELGNLDARIALSADDAFDLQIGQSYTLRSQNGLLNAQLKSIAKQRQLNTQTVDVIFALDDSQDRLLPGDMVEFSYETQVDEQGVWVPRSALTSGIRGLWTVFVVEPGQPEKLASKSVELLYAEEQRAYIRGPLSAGELLVINGTQRLVPNQLVKVKRVSAAELVRGKDDE